MKLDNLRLKLTLVNTAVLIAVSVLTALLIFFIINLNLENDAGDNLAIYSTQLASYSDQLRRTDDPEVERRYREFTDSLGTSEVAYLVWDQDFKAVDGSPDRPLDDEVFLGMIRRNFADGRLETAITDYRQDDYSLKVCTTIDVTDTGKLMVFQTVKDMNTERSFFQNALRTIVLVVLTGVVVSLLFGYFLSGRSLVPIQESVERQQEFLANASHELRTPIAVIKTNLEVVKSAPSEPVENQLTWLNNAYGEAQRMQNIVEDLMFLAKADSGDIHHHFAPFDLGFMIREVTERFVPLAAEGGLSLRSEVPVEELMVCGDEQQLSQVLVILIDNAIKYTEPGGRVTVTGRRDAGGVEILVADTGLGIAPEEQEKIFRRFYRVDKARSRAQGGTGLGLSIAAYIVKRHGGKIDVYSREGEGTQMRVCLPPDDKRTEVNHEKIEV